MSDNIHDLSSLIEHPRRNLGNRYRAQANRFVKLAKKDPESLLPIMTGQSKMLDKQFFMILPMKRIGDVLQKIKHLLGDGEGLEQTLRDLLPS